MRYKFFILPLICGHILWVNADPITTADKYYTTGNLTELAKVYLRNQNNRLISYLNAKAMLTKNISHPAEAFLQANISDSLQNDLIHQLLIFYFNNKNYKQYLNTSKLLPIKQLSINEKCGYDYANLLLNTKTDSITNPKFLINNGIPSWCINLAALLYQRKSISNNELNNMLYTQIASGRVDNYNNAAKLLHLNYINFDNYNNATIKLSTTNRNYRYLLVYLISNISRNTPDLALSQANKITVDNTTSNFLKSYIALQFALKQDFKSAVNLFSQTDATFLSNDELEWEARSYLFLSQWEELLKVIATMPNDLQNKNLWLYWNAMAYQNIGEKSLANNLLNAIPNDFSYYSILAQNQLSKNVLFHNDTDIAGKQQVRANILNNGIAYLSLYQLGKKAKSRNLTNIATHQWNYLIKTANDSELFILSKKAASLQLFNLSIAAAIQMDQRTLGLSFPTPFLAYFKKYSHLFAIDASYILAVARQESRFNYTVIAFDGGVGLMQIMPQTAAYIAKKSKSNNCYRSSFDCNIKFGSWYLANLYSKFNSNIIYATAAYNGGPNRARRWSDNLANIDNIRQIELIPVNITRDYVQKVLTNKAIYDCLFRGSYELNLLNYINKLNQNHYLTSPDDDHTDSSKL